MRNALRMRPERIIIGECRGAEALDMLQAMNTGHDGSMTTLHANTPRDALARLETMIMMAGFELPIKAMRQQIASAVDLIIQANRLQGGPRKVTSITEVMGMEQDMIIMQDIFRFKQLGIDQNGRAFGQFEATGVRPTFVHPPGSGRHQAAVELVCGTRASKRLTNRAGNNESSHLLAVRSRHGGRRPRRLLFEGHRGIAFSQPPGRARRQATGRFGSGLAPQIGAPWRGQFLI